ncbi:MAG: mannitol dehydrogenase family protein [Litorimonas sp.]
MSPLSAINLPNQIQSYEYDRNAITSGIVHFGIGNFHRAHQAVYCDDLLNRGDTNWGITGVSLRSSSMRDSLKPQDYLYTLATLGETTEYRIIGAIQDVVVAPEEPEAVINLISRPSTQLISSTITEKGYYLASSKIDFSHPDLRAELASLDTPKTIYGFLARGLISRAQEDAQAKLTIMCCDNISKGGEFLKDGVARLLAQHSPETREWADKHVGFVSSMVDRVCPATDEKLRQSVSEDTGRKDAWPVSAEPFSQWIIEGNFVGERPNFEDVGAVFVDDIKPFEQMKLRYLNAAHTIASTLGYLSGDAFVHEALARAEIFDFMRQALKENVLPHAAVPNGYDGYDYIASVIKRFQNENLPYANLQVGTDSSQKIQQRWFPTIDAAVAKNAEIPYLEFCLGAWVIFIQTALENGVLNDPKKEALAQVRRTDMNTCVSSYLAIASVADFPFSQKIEVTQAVVRHAETIQTDGIQTALENFLLAQTQKEQNYA